MHVEKIKKKMNNVDITRGKEAPRNGLIFQMGHSSQEKMLIQLSAIFLVSILKRGEEKETYQ